MRNINIKFTEEEIKILETMLYLSLIDTRMHLDDNAKNLVKHVLNKIASQKENPNE